MAERNSQIIISKNIKLDRNYTNVLDYTNEQMLTLMQDSEHLVAKALDCSFIRTTKTIKTKFTYQQCLNANYMAFQNPDYSNKWFFAWIDSVEYKADGCGEISFTIDYFTTWFKNLTINTCMVVREHINSNEDIAGANLVPENVDTGDYKVMAHLRDALNRESPDQTGISKYAVVVASTIDLNNDNNVYCAIYNGVPTGVKYFPFAIDYSDPEFPPLQSLANVLYRLASNPLGSKLDAIVGMFIVPHWLAKYLPDETISPVEAYTSITPLNNLDGYVPKNKKLLTYPYVYHVLSNFQGQEAILKQELWDKLDHDVVLDDLTLPAGDMVLQLWGAVTQGCSIRAVPENYNGDEIATDVGINLGKFPQICWNSDAFTNWLTENGVNIASSVGATALGVATGNAVMSGAGLSKGVDLLVSGVKASQVPPQVHGNTNNGDIMMAMDENCFHILKMSIRREFAERIDNYFSRYGYRTNKIKVPNITGRTIFNYVQIADDDIIGFGEIPSKALEQINNVFKAGVTIWHNHSNIGNYNINNT